MTNIAVSALVLHDRRLLLAKRDSGPGTGCWAPPGGKVNTPESLIEALSRELFEETGLRALAIRYIQSVELIAQDETYVIFNFLCTLRPSRAPRASSDAAEIGWFTKTNAIKLPLSPGVRALLDAIAW
ncbi:MAG: NUDIX hydrolase [Ferrimicrobium sp.]